MEISGINKNAEQLNTGAIFPFTWKQGLLAQGVGIMAGKAFGLDALARAYAVAKNGGGCACAWSIEDEGIFECLLNSLRITPKVSQKDMSKIPQSGPVVVVSNHPFGMIEGIILGNILESVRSDWKILGNYLLGAAEEIRDKLILVDPFGRTNSAKNNLKGMRESIEWLKSGGMLVIFPAGEVSHFDLKKGVITDPEWKLSVARLIRRTGADVLPVHFGGANGPLFQLLGLVHPGLRTLMLPHALLDKKGKKIEFRIGKVIPESTLRDFQSDREMLDYLRMRTYILGGHGEEGHKRLSPGSPALKKSGNHEEIVPPVDSKTLAREISFLLPQALILEHGEFQVFCAEAWQIPKSMKEIGRLREAAFRKTAEGTGKALDLDPFDAHYMHLFLWNRNKSEIAGAYRLGQTDRILNSRGIKGLYTGTLFRYDQNFLNAAGTALELGRSFISPEYQKSHSALLLLWKGIGHYVSKNPWYKVLFGPVSISREYMAISKKLMMSYFKKHHFMEDLAKLVRAKDPIRGKNPFRVLHAHGVIAKSIEDLSLMVSEIEPDGKDIPILLRQYLKLGGKLLGFSRDKKFSDVLDGLVLVNLAEVDPRILKKYMGTEGTQRFLAFHNRRLQASA